LDHPEKRIDVDFSAPQISSDGGLLLLRRAENVTQICEKLASLLPDSRDQNKVVHSRTEQIMQRAFMIACGYEDCNDADSLRHDPLFKTVCDSTPRDENIRWNRLRERGKRVALFSRLSRKFGCLLTHLTI